MKNEEDLPLHVSHAIDGHYGKSYSHESAGKHVSGEALYIDDIPVPAGALHAYVGLSTIAHGRLLRLDLDAVRAAPGVVAVVTSADVPGQVDIGPVFPGDPLMVEENVECVGQVLFAVAATSEDAARRAVRLAVVEYQPLVAQLTITAGLAANSFVRPTHSMQNGDPGAAIASAPHSLKGQMNIGGQEHFYLEGQVSLCIPQEDDGMLVYSSTQSPSGGQKLVARVLGIPMNRVIFDTRRMGGGFGGKETHASQWACIAALLAHKTARAIKIRLDRADDMLATGKRHHFLSEYEVGFDEEGRILGIDMTLSAGCGMSPDLSDSIVDRAMFHADNAYFLPSARITGHRVKTHTVSNTAFRGFGGPQGMLSIENVVDDVARAVGRDPLDVRKLNFYCDEGDRDTTHYGQKIERHIIGKLVERLELTSGYRERRRQIADFNHKHPFLRKGLSLTPVKFGISFMQRQLNQAGALLHVYTDGSIQINHGGTEMGQGLHTKIAQVVAQEFQVDMDRIQSTSTRTDKVPNTSATAASSSTDLNGMAACYAARVIKSRLIDFAASHFDIPPESVTFTDNRVVLDKSDMTFIELVQLAYMHRISLSATGYYRTPKIDYDRESGSGRPYFYFAYGAAVSEVLVDTLTGEYRVSRVDICQDVGQSLNPAVDIGQIEGGYIQGMGWVTTEELVWGEDGCLQTLGPATYKIPTIGDCPPEFNVELFPDSPNVEATIFHSKAVGEPPLLLGVSVWSALRDAVSSLAGYLYSPAIDTPATPERVLNACNEMRLRNMR